MVTSPQSVYSLASCVQDTSDNVPITNPSSNNSTIKEMEHTYGAFTSYLSKANLGSNPVYNSASSAGIINELDKLALFGPEEQIQIIEDLKNDPKSGLYPHDEIQTIPFS